MTITNMKPPMPHPHQAPTHPSDRPHVSFNNPAGPMGPGYLTNQMKQLYLQEDRNSSSHEARSRDFVDDIDIDEHTGTCYIGYTFFKAQTTPGSQPNWKKVERTRMNLRQNDLADLVRKNSKRISVASQYQSLSNIKRTHVDRLIDDLRQSNPRFRWMCVYAKEETRDVKGKNFRRGDYETTSMTVILMGKSISRSTSEESIQLREQRPARSQRLSPEDQYESADFDDPFTEARHGADCPPAPAPSHVSPMQRGPVQIQHQGPPPFRPPPQNVMGGPSHPEPAQSQQRGPFPFPSPVEIAMGGPPHPEPAHFQQRGPHPLRSPPQNIMGGMPHSEPAQTQQQGQPPFRQSPHNIMAGLPHQEPAQFREQSPNILGPQPQNVMGGPPHPELGRFREQSPRPLRPPAQNVMGGPPHPEPTQFREQSPPALRSPPQTVMGGPPHPDQGTRVQVNNLPPYPAPVVHNHSSYPVPPDTRLDAAQDRGEPRPTVNPEFEFNKKAKAPSTTSRKPQVKVSHKRDKSPKHRHEPEPELVYDDTSSGDEIMTPGNDDEASEEEFSSRGSKTSRSPWRGSLYRGNSSSKRHHDYRTHYRKEPQRIEDRGYRRYRDDGIVDIIPAASTYAARQLGRTHGSTRNWGAQPRIIHQQPSQDELELLISQARGRAQNDIRSRMLNTWEAELAEREHLFEYQKQMLKDSIRNDRMDDFGFINRSRSLRDQVPPYTHRGYLR